MAQLPGSSQKSMFFPDPAREATGRTTVNTSQVIHETSDSLDTNEYGAKLHSNRTGHKIKNLIKIVSSRDQKDEKKMRD